MFTNLSKIKIIENFHKRCSIKNYVRVLSRLLKKRYGKHKRYSAKQIKEASEAAGLDPRFLKYAYVIYMSRQDFDAMIKEQDYSWDYYEMRQIQYHH